MHVYCKSIFAAFERSPFISVATNYKCDFSLLPSVLLMLPSSIIHEKQTICKLYLDYLLFFFFEWRKIIDLFCFHFGSSAYVSSKTRQT